MLFLRIPHRFAICRDPIFSILRNQRKTLPLFALRSQEIVFCRTILQQNTNWWLFRCNQKKAIGDFLMVNMSSSDISLRSVLVVELKYNQNPKPKKGFQLRNSQLVIAQLIKEQIISFESPVFHIHSGGKKLLFALSQGIESIFA